MAKTTVDNFVSKMKRMYDYNITDTDLDSLLVDFINDGLKLIYQDLADHGVYNDIGASTTLTTVADQAYIDISTTLATMDELLRVSERTNDRVVGVIPYRKFVKLYPDPDSDTANTPDHAAIWAQRLYLGPTPTAAISIYAEYTAIPTDIVSGNTLPYKTKYDPLLRAYCRLLYLEWQDANNAIAIERARAEVDRIRGLLIVNAARNVGMNQQSSSRRDSDVPYIEPQVPLS